MVTVPNLIHTHDLPTHTQLGHGCVHFQGGLWVLGVHQVFYFDARLVTAFASSGIGDVIGFVVEQKQINGKVGQHGLHGKAMVIQQSIQAIGVVVTTLWCIVGTYVALKICDLVTGLRVSADQEREGLDIALHGEALHQ
jgi:Amt family ammonium transporter